MTEVDQSLVATLKRNQLSAGESAGVLVKVTRGQDLNGESVCQEEESMCRGPEPSKGPRGSGVRVRCLVGLVNAAVKREHGQGNWRGALGLCHQGLRHLGLDPVGNKSQKTGSRVVSHLSMTVDLWESCLNTSIFYTFFNGICFLFIKK